MRPEPLSAAVVSSKNTSVVTRAKLLAAVLDKVKEVQSAHTPVSSPPSVSLCFTCDVLVLVISLACFVYFVTYSM